MGRDSAARALPKVEKRPPRSDKLDSRHRKRRQVIVQAKTSRLREHVFRIAAVDQAACHRTAAVPPATSASASGAAVLVGGVAMRPPPADRASCAAARLLRCCSSSCTAWPRAGRSLSTTHTSPHLLHHRRPVTVPHALTLLFPAPPRPALVCFAPLLWLASTAQANVMCDCSVADTAATRHTQQQHRRHLRAQAAAAAPAHATPASTAWAAYFGRAFAAAQAAIAVPAAAARWQRCQPRRSTPRH